MSWLEEVKGDEGSIAHLTCFGPHTLQLSAHAVYSAAWASGAWNEAQEAWGAAL